MALHLPLKLIAVGMMFAAPAGWYISDIKSDEDDALHSELRHMGFVPLKMPSTGIHLGSIYAVEMSGDLQPVCEADKNVIDQIVEPYQGLQKEVTRLSNDKFSFSIYLRRHASSDVVSQLKSEVHYKIRNITVKQIPLDQDSVVQTDLLSSHKGCDYRATQLLKLGKYVCQVQAIFQANADYTMNSKTDVNDNTKAGTKSEPATVSLPQVSSAKSDEIAKAAVKEVLETHSGAHVSESTTGLKTDDPLTFAVKMDPICISPKNAIYIHTFPDNRFQRFVNYIKYDVIEPFAMKQD